MFKRALFMLKSEYKQAIILFVLSFLLKDVLTVGTLIFSSIGVFCVLTGHIPPKWGRTILSLFVFGSYWITYGKVIDPEVGLNFLLSVVVLKLMEKETLRDQYMIFFGLLLIISAGSLFERTLSYTIFFGLSFVVLLLDFYSSIGLRKNIKELGSSLLWVLPLTLGLFFFVPRMLSPIPLNPGASAKGEIGYTPIVNISEIDSLVASDRMAFQAMISEEITQTKLYWRGNTLSISDGWNWSLNGLDSERSLELSEAIDLPGKGIVQTIRLYNQDDFFFALDRPYTFKLRNGILKTGRSETLPQIKGSWVQRYQVESSVQGAISSSLNPVHLRSGLPKEDKEWIHSTFKSKDIDELMEEIKGHFLAHQFTYSLKPGRVENFRDFMLTKKIGLCSHYASAVAHILRVKKIPTRLISGFMGGNYNSYAEFYQVTQNDAHTWIEVYRDNTWVRVDPTEWIAPDRVILGGEGFLEVVDQGALAKWRIPIKISWMKDFQQWFNQWDFKFYQWLEQMDYYGQEAILLRLQFKREWLYALAPLLLVVFIGLYTWQLQRGTRVIYSREEKLLQDFFKKLARRGIDHRFTSVRNTTQLLATLEHPEKEKLLFCWELLIHFVFGQEGSEEKVRQVLREL
jgi:protein-glutamine gamma-glutamyltransferase